MISKIFKVFISIFLLLFSPYNYAEENNTFDLTAILRPIIIRSDFASTGTIDKLSKLSKIKGYDLQGYPILKKIYANYNLSFYETRIAQSKYYAKILNKHFKQYILSHPEKFSAETIADYSKGLTSRNPRTIDGIPLEWHHDGKHRFYLVEKGEHHSKPHIGGNKIWGAKEAESSHRYQKIYKISLKKKWSLYRWMNFSAFDILSSTLALAISNEKNYKTYAINTSASVAAGITAWSIESLFLELFPLTAGTTPYFIGKFAINVGGIASWTATGTFILMKYIVMTTWKKYQKQQALEIEKACRYAETIIRIKYLKNAGIKNSEFLIQIINKH